MQKLFLWIGLCCATVACTVEYDMKPTNVPEPDRIGVNSFIHPASPLCVYFFTVNRTDKGFVYQPAENVQVRLTEDDRVLFDGLCDGPVLRLSDHPKASARYRIEASLSGYESVWAETTVPEAVLCEVKSERFNENEMKFYLSDFKGNYAATNASLYVSAYTVTETDTLIEASDLYASNVLIDGINRSNGIEVKDADVGSSYYENFIRIKNRNIPHLDRLIFVTWMSGYYWDEWGENTEQKKHRSFLLRVTTAGPEYDLYYRTFYSQMSKIVYDDDISAIVYQPVQVYSNINGGLGIFAGANAMNCLIEIPD
jgi:hypothetical protein